MEGDGRLKLIIGGLVLAAIAIGYLIFTQRFQRSTSVSSNVVQSGGILIMSPTPSPTSSPSGSTLGANAQTLPKTGFPVPLAITFTASGMIAGWFLRKFPD